ncbi:MAG: protein kinase [Candidatus Omnitrophica bacterium]|nr:protein kinase [Candidatus Omnitrophota bacterium]
MSSENFITPYKKGDFIGQTYEVYDVLGMGGFGIVYLVYAHKTESVYALKTLRDEYLWDKEAQERFKKEAKIWIDMDRHPYLVRARFVEEISGRLFIVIDYIAPDENGLNSLDGYLKHRPPDLNQSLRWGIQFCHGMEYAYSKGIKAHRDIKPANIMIGTDKTLKITDFGIAGVIGNARISGI